MGERGGNVEQPGQDPFARMAAALSDEPGAPARPPGTSTSARALRRSRPSFSNLAPVVRATPPPAEAAAAPPVVVHRVHVVGEAPPSRPASPRLSFLPSVIVADHDPPAYSISPPTGTRGARQTTRRIRRRASAPRGLSSEAAVVLLAVSLLVFGAGLAALLYGRPLLH